MLDLLNPYRWLLAAVGLGLLCVGLLWGKAHYDNSLRDEGRAEVRAAYTAAALREQESKARVGLRRIEHQEENQRAQDKELAAARAAAARNAADADRVREQSATAAREWSARLADSPSREDLATAGAAIAVCADVRGRLDQAAGILAAYAAASRAAGLKCERDYDALKR